MMDFLIKPIQCYGNEALILLNLIKKSKDEIEYFIEKVHEKQVNVDINFLKPLLIGYLCNQKVEMKSKEKMNEEIFLKMLKEYEQKIESMKNKFDRKLELIKDKYNDKIISKTENRNNKYKKKTRRE